MYVLIDNLMSPACSCEVRLICSIAERCLLEIIRSLCHVNRNWVNVSRTRTEQRNLGQGRSLKVDDKWRQMTHSYCAVIRRCSHVSYILDSYKNASKSLLGKASRLSWPFLWSRRTLRILQAGRADVGRSIWASTSRCAPAHATLDRRPSHCCACHFDGHHSPDDRSALPHLWLGTHCHRLC